MVDEPVSVKAGDRGPAVSDVQRRLADLALIDNKIPGVFDDATEAGVRAFQDSRNLPPDGIVGSITWEALIEAGWHLGDRVLYERHPPWQRGEDVAELQERLGNLGFAVGKIDAIFGPLARQAVTEFQRNSGLVPDGVAGSETVRMIERVQTAPAAKPSLTVRERVALRKGGHGLAGQRIFIDPRGGADEPGVLAAGGLLVEADYSFALALELARRLREAGAETMFARASDTCPTASDRAALANWYGADVVIGIGLSAETPPEGERGRVLASYYGTHRFESSAGKALAGELTDECTNAMGFVPTRPRPVSRPLLRETRAVAVQVEFAPDTNANIAEPRKLRQTATAITRGLRRFATADADSSTAAAAAAKT